MRMIRLLGAAAAVAALTVAGAEARAATFAIDPAHSAVAFKVRHLVGLVPGQFDAFAGTLDLDPDHPASGSVQVEIQAASINTRNSDRDTHLRGADFFDAEKYPSITFTSTAVSGTGDHLQVTGDLTLHGVTRPVTLDVRLLGLAPDPRGNLRAGFTATTTLDRKEFGIVWNRALDAGGLVLGDEVEVEINIEAVARPAAPAAPAGQEPQ